MTQNKLRKMKQFLRYILTLVVILLTTTPAWAVDCHQVTKSTFTTDGEYSEKNWIGTTKYYYFTPKDQCIFTIDNDWNLVSQISFTATGDTDDGGELKFKIIYKTASNSAWQEIGSEHILKRSYNALKVKFEPGVENITLNATTYPNLKNATEIGIRFTKYIEADDSGNKSDKRTITISNFNVTFSQYFTSDKHGKTLEFPSTEVNTTSTTKHTVAYNYNNTVTSCTWKSDNPMFSVAADTHAADCSGTKNIVISFRPTEIRSEITGTITGTDNNGNKIIIYVKGSSWGLQEPTYIWNPTVWNGTSQVREIYVNNTINDLITYTSSTAACTYSITQIEDGGINNGDATCTFLDNTFYAGRAGRYRLTVSQPASVSGSSGYTEGSTSIELLVKKYTTNFAINFADEYYVDDAIAKSTFYTPGTNNEVNVEVSDSKGYFTYTNNTLTANGNELPSDADQTTITVTQPETYKWTGKTLTQQVWVKKHEVRVHINPSTAVWNDIVDNPFSASSTHKVVGTVTPINGFSVAQEDNAHIGQLDPNTYHIQTYHTSGTAHFRVTRPADRKYQALNQVVGLTVSKGTETCYIMEDLKEREWSTIDNSGEYVISGGMPDSLIFQAKRTEILGVSNTSYFYAEYKTASSDWTRAMTINLENTDTWYDLKCDIPETAIYVRFITETGATGNKHIRNLRVTRKQYLEPQITGKDFYLTQASIRMNFEGTFILDWSTCADEILLTCDNPSFVITPSVIDASEQKSGSTPITITCRDENATNLVGKVTIYDQMQQTDFYVHCKYLLQHIVWDQYFNNLETDEAGNIAFEQALNAYAATVDGTPTGAPVTYTLDENAEKIARIETINGVTTLYVTGQGDGKITASVETFEKDGRTYSADEVTRDIRVRKYGDLCNTTYHLSDGFNLYTIQTSESFNIQGMNAGTLLFNAYKDWYGVNYFYVQFSTDNEVSWSDKHIELDSENKDYTVLIPDGTTHLRFVTKTGATFYKYISNIYVKQKMELTPDTKQINETIYVNTPYERTIRVTYSDIPAIQTNLTQNTTNRLLLTPNQPVINNCGDFGTYDYTLSGEWSQPQTITETLRFFTSAGLPQIVSITLYVVLGTQEFVSVKDGQWSSPSTWNKSVAPKAYDNVRIEHQVSITTPADAFSLTMAQGASLNITSTGGLNIHAGGYTTNNTSADITLDYLQSGSAYLRISPEWKGARPQVKIRYQTRSTLDTGANKDATWQYIGAPGANCQFTVDYITWLYQWSEPQNWLQQSGTLTLSPFAGYAITQYGQPTYELTAEAITADRTITLTKTPSGMNGDNLFANSYMAPIDAKNFTPEDFSDYGTGREDIEKTFYVFNSGSWNQWNQYDSLGNTIGGNGSTTPGQYCAIPALSSKYLNNAYDITTIPPMQGVYVIANSNNAAIYLNYDKHVWRAASTTDLPTNMNEAMRSPQRMQAEQQMEQDDFRRLRLQVNSANSGADRMYLIQTSETTGDYDNGYDAPNQMAEGLANIYTTEHFGKMEVSCSNHIDSTYIGFQAGADSQYTLSVSSLIGNGLYLKDLSNDSTFLLIEGQQYQFVASPLSTNDMRFQLLLHIDNEEDSTPDNEGVTTDIDNVTGAHIWHSNDHVYISNAPANSTLALYTINGQLILSTNIPHTTHTVDLNYLPQGVYLLQLGCQMYKFVRQ